jgi:CRP-like cAMP-binding protein
MEELHYVKGEIIIEQDDIGDAFFVLEEGIVSVTVSKYMSVRNRLYLVI